MKNNHKLINKFKKLSSLDILGIFAIFFITASIYLFLGRKTQYLEITIRLFNHNAPEYRLDSNQTKHWYIEHIKPGKIQKSALGVNLIEITDVYSYPNGDVYNDVYVTLKIKTAKNKITQQYIYEGSPLLIHDVRTFRIQDLLLSGEIMNIGHHHTETKKIKVILELESKKIGREIENNSQAMIKGVRNYIADKITTGMDIKDSRGQKIVDITAVKKTPGKIILVTTNGMQNIPDSDRTQVTIETELMAEKINDHYYYRKEEPLMIDESLWLTFDGVTVRGVITSIEEIE